MTFNSSAIESNILKVLTEEAANVAQKAKANASWSARIPQAIKVGKAEKVGKMRYQVDVIIDSSKDGPAPHAAAFEYGSGIHGESGAPYIIPGAPLLAIPRERWPKYTPPPDVDPVVLESVEHPGVKAKPYMKPAVISELPRFVKRISKAFKDGYKNSVPKVTVIRA